MLAGEGLQPSSKGARVQLRRRRSARSSTGRSPRRRSWSPASGSCRCKSLEECIEWVKRCPNPMPGESEIEIRQVFEAEDFGEELTPELREQEERLRAQAARTSRRARERATGGAPSAPELRRTIDAVWRIESPRLIAGLTRMVRDVGLAEDLAQDALVAALEQWPRVGRPGQSGRLADGDGQAPRDRPAAPRRDARSASRSRSGASSSSSSRRRSADPTADAAADDAGRRRPARADLHVLPPGALDRGAGGADAAAARRADDGRDRARVPDAESRRWRSGSCARSGRCRARERAVRGAAPATSWPSGCRRCWR